MFRQILYLQSPEFFSVMPFLIHKFQNFSRLNIISVFHQIFKQAHTCMERCFYLQLLIQKPDITNPLFFLHLCFQNSLIQIFFHKITILIQNFGIIRRCRIQFFQFLQPEVILLRELNHSCDRIMNHLYIFVHTSLFQNVHVFFRIVV